MQPVQEAGTGVQRHPSSVLIGVTCDTTSTFSPLCSLMIRACARRTAFGDAVEALPVGRRGGGTRSEIRSWWVSG